MVDGHRTVVTGAWAGHVQEVLQAGGVACATVGPREYAQHMVGKLLWASVFWMMSAAQGGAKVGVAVARPAWARMRVVTPWQVRLQPLVAARAHVCEPVLAAHAQVGQIAMHQRAEVEALVRELLPIATAYVCAMGAQRGSGEAASSAGLEPAGLSPEAACELLLGYSLSIAEAVPSAAMAEREFAWRNGFFLSARPAEQQPLHVAWLRRAGYGHLIPH